MSDVTRILECAQSGDPNAAEKLLPLVYDELRKLAAHKMAHEAPGQTLQPTALVHEAWLKLAGSNRQQWRGRAHFFGAASEAMRRILIDVARRKAAQKRDHGGEREDLHESHLELRAPAEEALAVNEALDEFASKEPLGAQIVKLRYFMGMTVPEIAEALEVSVSTVERHWSYAKAWLRTAVRRGN
jgi:RNA polymerase sigma factor (TIGR02999 family)